jgi:hypothetical protein
MQQQVADTLIGMPDYLNQENEEEKHNNQLQGLLGGQILLAAPDRDADSQDAMPGHGNTRAPNKRSQLPFGQIVRLTRPENGS